VGVWSQIVEEKDEHAFDFDLLDPTKLMSPMSGGADAFGKLSSSGNQLGRVEEIEVEGMLVLLLDDLDSNSHSGSPRSR